MLSGLWALTFRELKSWSRSRLFALSFLVGPFVWVFVFGSAFNSVFASGGTTSFEGAPNYFNFITTGMLVVMPMTYAGRSGTSIFADRAKGYLDRLLVSPTSKAAIVHAKVFGAMVLGLVQALVLLVVAIPFGLKLPAADPATVVLLVGTVLLLSYGISSVYIMVSLKIRRWSTQQFALSLISTPLTFLSNAFYPGSRIPGWISGLVSLNPISYAINVMRELFFGTQSGLASSIPLDFAVLLAFAAACSVALVTTSRKWL